MNDEAILKLIESLGDDAKTAFITYLCIDYGMVALIVGLTTWGIRTVWKEKKDRL